MRMAGNWSVYGRLALLLSAVVLAGCDGAGSPANDNSSGQIVGDPGLEAQRTRGGGGGGASVPSREKYDQLRINMTLKEAEDVLGPGQKPATASDALGKGQPKGPDVEAMMQKLDWYLWGPGDSENYLYLGVTKDDPPLVKHVAYSRRHDGDFFSSGMTCPIKVSQNVSTGEKSMEWGEP